MGLQDLIDQYVAKMRDIDQLIEEKALAEKKLALMAGDRKGIRNEISNFLTKAGGKGIHCFLFDFDGKQLVCQIDLGYHPEREEFITFCEVSPIEEFTSTQKEDVINQVYDLLENASDNLSKLND